VFRIHRKQRGVSLVEALVSMAIMGFGMLAIVGVQGTLRFNGDVSKQRGEATRLAERELERLRGFSLVASGTADESEFDEIDSVAPEVHTPPDVNATFTLKRTIMPAPDGSSKMVHVLVEWFDRTGQKREVSMHDVIARVDPVLSGLVKAGKPLTPIGRRNQRHPTIPERAHNLGDGATSIFKPVESGTVAWVFNNSTGQITHTCTVSAAATSASLTSTAGCTATKGQLLAGEIRFNLRGGANNLGAESAFKPVASGDVAWVIDHGLQRLVRICPVSAGATTASLTAASVATGCTPAAAAISPFAPDDDGHVLTASDSENPLWPSIPATVKLDTSVPLSAGMTAGDMTCYSNARTSSLAPAITLPVQRVTEYFCIITAPDGWSARTVVDPIAFSDGNAAVWSIGAVAGTYKVCRYTTAADGYTTNEDHPAVYGKDSATCGLLNCRRVTGNLINQNFLIIDGTKNCPTDGPADPASGDLVNSKTLQHQP
jgi:hypothetical protein